jgi:hypothetical protein
MIRVVSLLGSMEDGLRVVNDLLLLPDFGGEVGKKGFQVDLNVRLRIYIL